MLLRFCARLLLLMTALFCLHFFTIDRLDVSAQGQIIAVCYLFNTLFALSFFVLLLFVSKYNPSILGWVFLITSGLKFLLFFALIFPNFQLIGLSQKQEFFTFFIPYAAALILEIHQLIKILNPKNWSFSLTKKYILKSILFKGRITYICTKIKPIVYWLLCRKEFTFI